jgi:hypothetical protein
MSVLRHIAFLLFAPVFSSAFAAPPGPTYKPGTTKKFYLRADQIAPVALGLGGCLATDRIVIDGARVGYMFREKPVNPQDSGWRFFAGDESPGYMADNEHHGVYDVNTIVNYDPDVLPHLGAPVGSQFERDRQGQFRPAR